MVPRLLLTTSVSEVHIFTRCRQRCENQWALELLCSDLIGQGLIHCGWLPHAKSVMKGRTPKILPNEAEKNSFVYGSQRKLLWRRQQKLFGKLSFKLIISSFVELYCHTLYILDVYLLISLWTCWDNLEPKDGKYLPKHVPHFEQTGKIIQAYVLWRNINSCIENIRWYNAKQFGMQFFGNFGTDSTDLNLYPLRTWRNNHKGFLGPSTSVNRETN
jgi:hypothetical protein